MTNGRPTTRTVADLGVWLVFALGMASCIGGCLEPPADEVQGAAEAIVGGADGHHYDLRSGSHRTFQALTGGSQVPSGTLYVGPTEVAIAAYAISPSDQVIRFIQREAFE